MKLLILLTAAVIVYSNIYWLNGAGLEILPLGAILLLVVLFFFVEKLIGLMKVNKIVRYVVIAIILVLIVQVISIIPQSDEEGYVEVLKNKVRNESNIEREIFELTNTERERAGKTSLVWDEELRNIAKNHSKDMIEKGYFEHSKNNLGENIGEVPISWIPFFLLVEDCIITITDSQIASCHLQGWKNSEGHYLNMISESYSKIGVGVNCDFFSCKATQNFK